MSETLLDFWEEFENYEGRGGYKHDCLSLVVDFLIADGRRLDDDSIAGVSVLGICEIRPVCPPDDYWIGAGILKEYCVVVGRPEKMNPSSRTIEPPRSAGFGNQERYRKHDFPVEVVPFSSVDPLPGVWVFRIIGTKEPDDKLGEGNVGCGLLAALNVYRYVYTVGEGLGGTDCGIHRHRRVHSGKYAGCWPRRNCQLVGLGVGRVVETQNWNRTGRKDDVEDRDSQDESICHRYSKTPLLDSLLLPGSLGQSLPRQLGEMEFSVMPATDFTQGEKNLAETDNYPEPAKGRLKGKP